MRRNARGGWVGDRSQSRLWTIPALEDQGFDHGTQKPLERMRRPIANNRWFRFVRHGDRAACETEGWVLVADRGPVHGRYSALIEQIRR